MKNFEKGKVPTRAVTLIFYGQSAGCAPVLEATEFPEVVTLLRSGWDREGEDGQDERRILRTV